ncbi:hypothetical protein HID58_088483 [Brassica napus]|uniref:Replication factor A C-terminal domain-containing protein n=1 Tax=Brassica napus TaxID=3708 RepID=A0ABQ7XWA8_BRANA|nr:hypothetical protein HID58_088483 [Brassica napus]
MVKIWLAESTEKCRLTKHPLFTICCKQCPIKLPIIRDPPIELENLLNEPSFRSNIRVFNSLLNVEGYLSLLDEAAARFKGLLNSGETTNSVMVITNHLYLHSTAATKFYFGNNLTAITEFTMSPTGDLSKFLSNSSSQSLITQEAYFTCIAQTVEGVAQKGWYYVTCTHCGKEVGNSATSHPCDQCHDTNATTVVRLETNNAFP